jgi:hypothetical protein
MRLLCAGSNSNGVVQQHLHWLEGFAKASYKLKFWGGVGVLKI